MSTATAAGAAAIPSPLPSGIPHQLPTVPRLPDPRIPPDLHLTGSGSQLALPSFESISSLAALAADPLDYPFPEPLAFGLPPLPPIPAPPHSTRVPRTPLAPSARPILDPPIPSTSALFRSQACDTSACVSAFNDEAGFLQSRAGSFGEVGGTKSGLKKGKSSTASVKFGGNEVLVTLENGWVWVGVGESGRVSSVRAHLGVRTAPPVHALPPPGSSQTLSSHLTSLNLSLPALLYRIPRVMAIVDRPCIGCGQRLNAREGLALGGTGWLPGDTRGEPSASQAAADDVRIDSENAIKSKRPAESGRWVGWHTSCDPC